MNGGIAGSLDELLLAAIRLMGMLTAVAAAAVRLDQARREKDDYQHAFEGDLGLTP